MPQDQIQHSSVQALSADVQTWLKALDLRVTALEKHLGNYEESTTEEASADTLTPPTSTNQE